MYLAAYFSGLFTIHLNIFMVIIANCSWLLIFPTLRDQAKSLKYWWVWLIEKLVLKLKIRCNLLKKPLYFFWTINMQPLEIRGNCLLFMIFHFGATKYFHYQGLYFFPILATAKIQIATSAPCSQDGPLRPHISTSKSPGCNSSMLSPAKT